MLSWILIMIAYWNNSPRIYMLLHWETLFWFWTNQSLVLLRSAGCFAEKQRILNFAVFCLTRPELEPTIYRTRGEHANHYTTDEVIYNRNKLYIASSRNTLYNKFQCEKFKMKNNNKYKMFLNVLHRVSNGLLSCSSKYIRLYSQWQRKLLN